MIMIIVYDSEQGTQCMLNACFASDGTSDYRECNGSGEELF